jgi:hypothetical protein
MRTVTNSSSRAAAIHGDAYRRFLATGGYMIVSAIIVLSIAYLPTLASTILATLNIIPAHLV